MLKSFQTLSLGIVASFLIGSGDKPSISGRNVFMAKEIKLNGKYGFMKVAIVDDKDFNTLNQYRWHINNGYVRTRNGYGHIKMHQMILGFKDGYMPDHKDGNKLNNQRSNLRLCKSFQNCQNRLKRAGVTSKYKGVSLHVARNKYKNKIYIRKVWQSNIMFNGNAIQLGYFKDEKDAAIAYNEAARKYHGRFAKLNVV